MYDYLEWKKSHTAKTTPQNYERWVKRFHTFLERNTLDFTLEDVGRFKVHLQTKYSPKNIQYGLSILRDYVGYNVAVHGLNFPIHLFKVKTERSVSHHPVTRAQFELMVKSLSPNEPLSLQRRLMITMLFETGMRVGELMNLKISHLKPYNAIIHNEKNTRSRLIGWSERTESLVQKYLPLRRNLKCDEDWLFVSFRYYPTRQMTTRQVERIVREMCFKTGITDPIRPHSFRHGFVHRKLEEGKPITTVAQMLGHSTAMNVMNYARLSSKEIKEAWGIK